MALAFAFVLANSPFAEGAGKKIKRAAARQQLLLATLKQGRALQEAGKVDQAIKTFKKALALSKKLYGSGTAVDGFVWRSLGSLYELKGQYVKAQSFFERSLPILEREFGKDHEHVAYTLYLLAKFYTARGEVAKARPLYRRGLGILEAALKKNPSQPSAELCSGLAEFCRATDQDARAELFYKRTIQILEAKHSPNHPDVALYLNSLGTLYAKMEQYALAVPVLQRSLKIREERFGEEDVTVAATLNNLAFAYQKLGQYGRAEPLYQRSLRIREAKLPRDDPEVAQSLNNLGMLYKHMGQYAKAEPLLRRSLRIHERSPGKDNLEVATLLNNLGALYLDQEQFGKALPLFQHSLQIEEARRGPNDVLVASVLSNLGIVYQGLGRPAQAEPCYQRSLKIREAKLGKDHPDVAITLNNLAMLYKDTGRESKVLPLLERCLEIQTAQFGPNHPQVIRALNNLAVEHFAKEHWDTAGNLFNRARRAVSHHLQFVLPALSEREQLLFLRAHDTLVLHGALSLGLVSPERSGIAKQSANWVLNAKGMVQQTLAEGVLLARDQTDPDLQKVVQELLSIRKRLAALTFTGPFAGKKASYRRELARLAEREQELAKRLAQAGARPARADHWVELDAVRRVLPADAVLIEMFRVVQFNSRAKKGEIQWQTPHYVAWLIPPWGKGTVRVIDLGEAEKIEQRIRAVCQLIQNPASIRDLGEPGSEKELRKPLRELARLVLDPLAESAGRFPRWLLSPDASLWLVPWPALPLKKGGYAIEKYNITCLVSGRDLLRRAPKIEVTRPLVMADPDYDLKPEQARTEVRLLLHGKPLLGHLRGLGPVGKLPKVQRLPGTAAEARAILPELKKYAQASPRLYTGRKALEGVFKAVRRPRVVVLSTHGFFLADAPVQSKASSDPKVVIVKNHGFVREVTKPMGTAQNPLLRCGLLLAGCNNRGGANDSDDEDGVLTGLEIVGTELRGTELVVLSACETGLGEVRNGEGVAGLRQAFQLAGARAVVATLWQIPDRETARLMKDFFTHLADGKGKADALRAAQLAQIKARRARNGAAHPFFWAAFTLTGN
jgi:CHAT domain-containing protein/tetratricopeptide (TPR) repeat protein